jgi:PAN domain
MPVALHTPTSMFCHWSHSYLQDSPEACCDLCKADAQCNIWVFCPLEAGCGPGLPHRECWLKHLVAQPPDLAHVPGQRGSGVATACSMHPDDVCIIYSLIAVCKHHLPDVREIWAYDVVAAIPAQGGICSRACHDRLQLVYTLGTARIADVPWTSGAVYADSRKAAAEQRIAAENAAEQQRLLNLKDNPHLPLVYMDVEIKARGCTRSNK